MAKPACMDAAEYDLWQAQNDALPQAVDRASSPCADCLRAFAEVMRAEGCCDGEPLGDGAEDRPIHVIRVVNTERRRERNRVNSRRHRARKRAAA